MEEKRQTVLMRYLSFCHAIESSLSDGDLQADMLWRYHELLYRVSVIQTCQAFSAAAPLSLEPKELIPHYQMLSAFLQSMIKERRFGLSKDSEKRRQQDTAYGSFQRIVSDHCTRFQHYAPHRVGQYREDIRNVICTVLPAWIQYRDTLLSINLKEEALS